MAILGLGDAGFDQLAIAAAVAIGAIGMISGLMSTRVGIRKKLKKTISNRALGLKKVLSDRRLKKQEPAQPPKRAQRENVYRAAPKARKSTTYTKTDEERALIEEALANNFVFSKVGASAIQALMNDLEPISVEAGTDLITMGDEAKYFYIIKEGKCSVIVGWKKVNQLEKGGSFGETGMLNNSPRNATVRAHVDCKLWRLEDEAFHYALAIAENDQAKKVITALKDSKVFDGLSEDILQRLSECAVEIEFKKGQTIAKKGENMSLGYLVLSGMVRVTDLPDGVPDTSHGAGQHFGLRSMLSEEKLVNKATYIADSSEVIVAALSPTDISEILGDVSQLFSKEKHLKELQIIPLFADLTLDMISVLYESMDLVHFSTGEKIITQGEIGRSFFLIQEGECNVVHNDADGTATVVKTLKALNHFGEMALVDDEPRSADVVAVSDCVLYEVSQATFQRLFGNSTKLEQLKSMAAMRRESLSRCAASVSTMKLEELSEIKVLGSGAFGVVSLVKTKDSSTLYALKAISIEFVERNKQEANIVGEKKALKMLNHPFIGKFHSVMRDRYRVYFLLDFINGSGLFDVLHNTAEECVPENRAKFYAANVALALEHFELRSMAYRDLKPENAIVGSDGYITLIDFGFAKVLKGKSFTQCGTPEYMAPELIMSKGHNRSVDYFALGVMIYEMICGQTPFFDYITDGIYRKILSGKIRFGPKFNEPLKDLITQLLSPNPVKRLGIRKGGVRDILRHEWFSDIDTDLLAQKGLDAPWVPKTQKVEDMASSGESMSIVQFDEDYISDSAWLNEFGDLDTTSIQTPLTQK